MRRSKHSISLVNPTSTTQVLDCHGTNVGAMGSVVITGGSRGIGASVALRCAEQGWDVAIDYVTRTYAATEVVDRCRDLGVQAVAVQGDVADHNHVRTLFDAAEAFGPLGGLVNNAGVVGQMGTLAEATTERLARIVEINVFGALLCAREAMRRLTDQGGAIVNVSSAASRLGSAFEFVDYAATKGAMDTMTIGLAGEGGPHGIRVNAVRPGLIHTDIHASGGEPGRVERLAPNIPLKRGGTADEVAATIVWLLSDDASYVSGALLDVSGGR